ncbi:glycosyltransferase family 4 protein [Dyella telluris]|uniref:Glycosyltransferase family 4 protein n=1 Tax=Dyella telluris TaxID=2763498 RepID=A0A7G8Q3D8_9GAMM|nr:glycosyltransferase family 4 protein [Dyella telluris]QNK01296.1 glycosyltransferase family 4 protein [Dyella telluris]
MRPLRVAQISFHPAPKDMGLADTLAQWPSLADIAEAAASAGARVTVVQRAGHAERLQRNGVEYRFVADRRARANPAGGEVARTLAELRVDVAHVHSLAAAAEVHALARVLPDVPILMQDHADPLPAWWGRARWRRWYASARGAVFTAPELASPYVSTRLFDSSMRLFAIPESSSRFTPGARSQAWSETGLYGDPCVVWVGHFSSNKDPLTVLKGIALATESLPGLQLWCAFGSAPLLARVHQCIQGEPSLQGRVHLLGKVPHAKIQSLMRAADLYVSGSHAESCGYALLEAMACGVTPVVTNIPSFRAIAGELGYLWVPGDAASLAKALVNAATRRAPPGVVRDYFERHLSPQAVGRRWMDAYLQLARGNRGADA